MNKNITVKELIEKLNQFDENATVDLVGFAREDYVEEIYVMVEDEDIFSQTF